MSPVAVWTYLTLAVFVLGLAARAVRWARMPLHLRWELYPIGHEDQRLPVPEHGTLRRRLVEWRVLLEEVTTLRMVREGNPGLWPFSLAFHWGLYLLFALAAALVVGAVARLAGSDLAAPLAGSALLTVWGAAGLTLGTLGGLGLLARRGLCGGLRRSSTPADFLHLALLLSVFAASWAAWLGPDRRYTIAAGYVLRLVTLDVVPPLPEAFVTQVVLLGVFLAYLPLSHMTHFVGKLFTWHSVRWDDRANEGGRFDADISRLLGRPAGWAASHVGAGKSWAEVVTSTGEEAK